MQTHQAIQASKVDMASAFLDEKVCVTKQTYLHAQFEGLQAIIVKTLWLSLKAVCTDASEQSVCGNIVIETLHNVKERGGEKE